VKRAEFDVILLDIQMPGMDGYETAEGLMQMKNDHEIKDVPIIALTANTQDSEIEKCFESGMDDYIAKSIWRPKWKPNIQKIINRWISGERDQNARSSQPWPELDNSVFSEIRTVMNGQLSSYVSLFLKDVKTKIESIAKILDDGENEKVVIPAHIIKSSSRLMGGMRLSAIAAEMEKKAAAKSLADEDLQELYSQMQLSFIELKRQLSDNLK